MYVELNIYAMKGIKVREGIGRTKLFKAVCIVWKNVSMQINISF